MRLVWTRSRSSFRRECTGLYPGPKSVVADVVPRSPGAEPIAQNATWQCNPAAHETHRDLLLLVTDNDKRKPTVNAVVRDKVSDVDNTSICVHLMNIHISSLHTFS